MKRFSGLLPTMLLAAALGALVIGWPYVFPSPTYEDLADECAQKCASYHRFGVLEREATPYSNKPSSIKYSCHCA
jgi:hypothetical protein